MLNGFLIVRKESGCTSHDVVAAVRRISGQPKVGHAGTLDPMARGVLPVCLGKATKAAAYVSEAGKEYLAGFLLGVSTDTQDITGHVLAEAEPAAAAAVSREQLEAVCRRFTGGIDQIPPMYSAKKLHGRKLYELAREGKEVERKPCRVRIDAIEICAFEPPRALLRVQCSSGTYIRTLLSDMGASLGTGGCMESLVRTRVGHFSLEEAKTLTALKELAKTNALSNALLPVDTVFKGLPAFSVKKEAARLLYNGAPLPAAVCLRKTAAGKEAAGRRVRIYDEEGQFIGIYTDRDGTYVPVRIFYASPAHEA